MDKPKIWVAYYDLHYPKYDKDTFKSLCNFLNDNTIDGFLFGGDQLDFECISHHTKGKPLYRTEAAYKRAVDGFNDDVLSPLERIIGTSIEKIYHIGNHERFEADLIEEHPELSELVNHVKILTLEARGWKIIPLGHSYRIGKLVTAHGEILSGSGNQASTFPAKKAVELYGTSVLAGHTHAPQSYTKISPVERNQKHMAWIAPTAGMVNPDYLRNRPTAWLNGFTIIEVWDQGNFNLYPVITQKGIFSYGGKVYRP